MLLFVKQFIKHRKQTGAIWPSSPPLAMALTRRVRGRRGPRRVLEVGPGTGAVTKRILAALRPGDEFHLVEVNPRFCEILERTRLRPFRARHQGVRVSLHCEPIETAPLDGRFDVIICGLPFNNFPPALVRAIFRRLLDLLAPGGELSYFEYFGVRAVKSQFVDAAGRRRLRQLGAMVRILRRRHAGRSEFVLGNIPPAVTRRLTRAS
jgi:phosphatidylethanolamine/phosphatidyl-N-methylethanolamine N-methyltransferase